METLSVDLANTSYANVGIVGLEAVGGGYEARAFAARDFGLTGSPSPQALADGLVDACEQLTVKVLLLDGPQGWKDPQNGFLHSRVCERILNTPGKTGLPGCAKPGGYLAFMAFSVAVFQALLDRGFRLFSGAAGDLVAVESFPLAAWRQLGLVPLPAKAKAKPGDLLRAVLDQPSLSACPMASLMTSCRRSLRVLRAWRSYTIMQRGIQSPALHRRSLAERGGKASS